MLYGRAISRLECPILQIPRYFRDGAQQARAAVPTQQSIVVSRRTDLFRILKTAHGALKAGQEAVREMAGAQLGFGPTLIEDSAVVSPFVITGELFKAAFGFPGAVGEGAGELICNGETKQSQRHLVFRINGENVPAN